MAEQIQNPKSTPALRRAAQNRQWSDAALILILALLPCLFFWRLITPNPADRMVIASGDFTEQYFPLRAFAAQEWVRGQVPLWNPYLYGGQPALADIQSGALYLPHVLESLLLGWGGFGFPLWALEWQVILHFSLAAVGIYLFARSYFSQSLLASSPPRPLQSSVSLRRARFGGVIASLVFTYGGYLTGFPVQQITILEVSAWLPWVMWAVSAATARPPTANRQPPTDSTSRFRAQPPFETGERMSASTNQQSPIPHPISHIPHLASRRLVPAFWGALAFAMAILAGHPQTVLYIFYLSLAYTAFHAFWAWHSESVNGEWRMANGAADTPNHRLIASRIIASHFVPWFIIILLGLAIAAAQLLPTLEFIAHSLRADLSYQAVSAGLPLNEFISILYPGFFGGSPEYVGIVSLVLIALALLMAQPRREVFFWAGTGLISLLLAFGGHTFLYPLFYLFTPGFDAVRQQERVFLVYSFSAAVLAGYGVIVLAGPLPKLARSTYTLFERRLRRVAVAALALTAFFIYGSTAATARGDEVNLFYGVLWHHLFGLIILGGLLVLLTLRSRRWLRRTGGMSLLALWLAFNLFTVNWRFNLEKSTTPPPFTPNGVTNFLQTNLPTRIVSGGLLSGGHSAGSVYNLQDLTGNTPLQLAAVATFLQQMPSWRAWQLLNVRYIVDNRNIADAGLVLVFEEGDLKVFEMGDPFPRAWFVAGTEVVAGESEAIARLAADDFDLRRTAIMATPLNLSPVDLSASTVSILTFSPSHLTAEINASDQQLLVFSQIYYSGWQAKIDGQPAELLRVNVIQQGVVAPAGQHTVELTYSPGSFWLGAAISVAAIIICLVLLAWGYKAGKQLPF